MPDATHSGWDHAHRAQDPAAGQASAAVQSHVRVVVAVAATGVWARRAAPLQGRPQVLALACRDCADALFWMRYQPKS